MSQVAVVTGGSTGIGKAICEYFLNAGYHVVSLARRPTPSDHPKFHAFEVDLTDPRASAEVVAEVARRFDVDTVVHNAGAIRPALLPEVRLADLDALVNLHLSAAVLLTQAMLPKMQAGGFGRVVLLSSRAALGLATRTAYAATKAGMIGMARTWALELGQYGITVNVVAPGPIKTDMFHEIVPADSPKVAQIAKGIPVRRLGYPDDVARAVMFFAAPENGFVTGQVLYVCGGTSVGSLVI